MAHDIFLQDYEYDFIYEHAWRVMRNEPKGRTTIAALNGGNEGGSKRSKVNESGSYSTSGGSTPSSFPTRESVPTRPIGIKSAKGQAKKVGGSSSDTTEEANSNLQALIKRQEALEVARVQRRGAYIEEQLKISNDYVCANNEFLRGNNINFLIVLMAKSMLGPEEERIKNKLMGDLFP